MTDRDPNIVISGLSGDFTKDGVTVEVHIIRLEDGKDWTLEVVNSAGTSIVWDDPFESDEQAYAEFQRTVAEEGMQTFLDEGYEPKVRSEEFQLWCLSVRDNATGIVTCDDGNGRIVYEQALNFTDFPVQGIRLYFCNGTILLPSEY